MMTLEEAYRELKSIENKIDLLETQRTILNAPKTVNLKDIMVSGGRLTNDSILNGIISSDKYSESLSALYLSKASYEAYIWQEIALFKDSKQGLIIHFLKHLSFRDANTKEDKKLTWREIGKIMNYSEKQCQRYYNEYRGRTSEDNCG